jgi:hypothetical protein
MEWMIALEPEFREEALVDFVTSGGKLSGVRIGGFPPESPFTLPCAISETQCPVGGLTVRNTSEYRSLTLWDRFMNGKFISQNAKL